MHFNCLVFAIPFNISRDVTLFLVSVIKGVSVLTITSTHLLQGSRFWNLLTLTFFGSVSLFPLSIFFSAFVTFPLTSQTSPPFLLI